VIAIIIIVAQVIGALVLFALGTAAAMVAVGLTLWLVFRPLALLTRDQYLLEMTDLFKGRRTAKTPSPRRTRNRWSLFPRRRPA
jgi:hypothetical protein